MMHNYANRQWQTTLIKTTQYLDLLLKNKVQNTSQVPYTVFVGTAVSSFLKIIKKGYRVITSPQNQHKGSQKDSTIALIVAVQDSLIPSDAILLPFSLWKKHGQKVSFKRINMGVQKIGTYISPKLPTAHSLHIYLNTSSNSHQILTDIISHTPFIITNRSNQYYYNISVFKNSSFIENVKNYGVKILRQFRRCIGENEGNKFTNYYKVVLKGSEECQQSEQIQNQQNNQIKNLLFQPKKTKIVIHRGQHYELNQIIKRIKLPQLYQLVFSNSSCYKKLSEIIEKELTQRSEKKMFLLKNSNGNGGKGLGISSFLHNISQKNQYHFQRINCKYFVSEKQLINSITSVENYSNSLIYIKNIQWLTEIGSDKNDKQQKLKRIVRNLQDCFNRIGDSSFSSHILVIGCRPGQDSIRLDMTKNGILQKFQPSKEEKIQILLKILHFYNNKNEIIVHQQQELVNLLANSIGWVDFAKILNKFMDKNKKQVKMDEFLGEVGKITQMEKVENVKNVTWDDVGGLENAKEEIIQTILLPTKHPEIFDQWIKPRTGLLFYGPPGTGKTMLGKCIANQCKMGFISVKGPQLLNMYIGESEKNVREVFERATASKPCIVFMDELDALIPKRGQSSDSNQVMDRIVSQLLMQMDQAAGNGIFIIGATNRPDLLDPSILRPGRFDKQIYLGISKDKNSRIQILKAQTRNIKLSKNFDFQKVIDEVPENFTGADFYGLTSRSIMKAAQRFIEQYEQKRRNYNQNDENPEDADVIVTQQDFIQTAKDVKPSVSLKQLEHYEKLKQQYK